MTKTAVVDDSTGTVVPLPSNVNMKTTVLNRGEFSPRGNEVTSGGRR